MNRPITMERVKAELIDAFRRNPGTAIRSPARGEFIHDLTGGDVIEWDILAACWHFIEAQPTRGQAPADAREDRIMVQTWARVSAQREGKALEASLTSICTEMGWNRQTFQRRVDAAIQRLANGLENARSGIAAVQRLRAKLSD
jgi:hypothetical protein